jgi:hypothetical protein
MTDKNSSDMDDRARTQAEFADLARVVNFFLFFVGLGLVGAVIYAASLTGWNFWGAIMWSLALLASGAGVGFLFGIPKVLQSNPAATPSSGAQGASAAPEAPAQGGAPAFASNYRQKVNTNLEEISDWLTKIIVGVSLIQLKSMPDHVWRLAGVISGSLGPKVPEGFGVALVLFFATSGFLFGYLVTRLYIQGALARAERSVEQEGVLGERELRSKSVQAMREVTQALSAIPPVRTEAAVDTSGRIDDELLALADQYLRVNAKEWSERVRIKNELTARMAAHVLQRGISRDQLAHEPHEGLLVALAAAVQHSPEPEDTRRLLTAAVNAHRLHVQYRFVLAFARLLERGFVSDADKSAIRQVLTTFEARADESLRLAIAGLRRQLD